MNAPDIKQDHAYQNATAWAGSITEMIAALECDYDRLENLRDEHETVLGALGEAESAEDKEQAQSDLDAWNLDNADELDELTAAATLEGELQSSADSVRERIQESPLSVEIRSGWTTPGGEMEPEEFLILLSTGGPALRIRGELDQYRQPDRAWLEYQDWGTPWTEYRGDGCAHSDLLTFCQRFYFGE